jgi:hypothetical protein
MFIAGCLGKRYSEITRHWGDNGMKPRLNLLLAAGKLQKTAEFEFLFRVDRRKTQNSRFSGLN